MQEIHPDRCPFGANAASRCKMSCVWGEDARWEKTRVGGRTRGWEKACVGEKNGTVETAELLEVLSPEGLRLLDSLPHGAPADVVRAVRHLRKAGHRPELVAAVLTQARLRSRARAKFGPFAERMLFTEDGLEQATRLNVAALHAARFQQAGIDSVADLGCGIGADALAMAGLDLEVTAVERDEVTAAIAAYNLAPWPTVTVEHADAEATDLSAVGGVYLDPARRAGGRRLTDPADWSPSLEFAFSLARSHAVGVKLGPGVDRDLIPGGWEAQWISVDRDVVELGLWSGSVARDGITRSALVIGAHGAADLTSLGDSEDAPIGPLGEYLLEPDGAVIRARLIGDLARRVDARMLSAGIAYLTADSPVDTPFASCFRVVATLPWDERTVRRELTARGIGTLEIKKRGADVDPARLRTRLALRGDAAATLVITRVAGRHTALICERV